MRIPSILALSAVLLLATSASADVVGPDPTDCPGGTRGNSCHGGPYCAPRVCTGDADCTDGTVCMERTQCIVPIDCGGLRPPDADPRDYEVDSVSGTCPASCTGECRTQMVCVSRDSGGGGSSDGGCGCSVPGGASGAGLALGLAIVLGLAVVTRRRR